MKGVLTAVFQGVRNLEKVSLETAKSIMSTIKIEKKLLIHSVILSIVFSIIGITAGLYTQSQMIMLDGLYSFISVMLSSLSFASAKFMGKSEHKKFPFGKSIVEPLVMIVKYSTILVVLAASVVSAVYSIATGGRAVDTDTAITYSLFSTFACIFMYLHLKRKSRKYNSYLLTAESSQWLFDTYASVGVLITFGLVVLLNRYQLFTQYLVYIDPIIVIIMSASFAKLPMVSVRNALRDVLGVSPEGELAATLKNMTKDIEEKYQMKESFLRVTNRRKLLRVEIDFIVDENSLVQSIKEQDRVREELDAKMRLIKTDKWITVAFTSNRKWAV